ncbi:MAG: outer membrane lipoprotein chaperone LolA [Myxococcota bacterium]|nr:outer membrane lipoprotein chaperone LolA [Myxococcota bacterium]
MSQLRGLGFSVFVLLWAFCSFAQEGSSVASAANRSAECGDANAALARLQARYDEIQDLSAVFTQVSESVVLAGTSPQGSSKSGGEVTLAKPGRMRWSYAKPDASVVVSDGHVLWIYDVAAQQVTRASVGRGYLAGAALQFLLGEGRLQDSFDVREVACSADWVELELKPRSRASYERIRATVDRASGLVSETAVDDLFGNRTILSFSEVTLNRSPDASVFVFRTPKGVEMIDLDTAH